MKLHPHGGHNAPGRARLRASVAEGLPTKGDLGKPLTAWQDPCAFSHSVYLVMAYMPIKLITNAQPLPKSGDLVVITEIKGDTAANGTFQVKNIRITPVQNRDLKS